jgi:hypothetical protein
MMNERIQKLIDQATRKAMWPGDPDAGELDAEKFAELIVRECIEVVGDCSIEYATRPQIMEEIKEHFGVEE